MATWKIIVYVFLILVILIASIAIIADYRKHKDDESISGKCVIKLFIKNFVYNVNLFIFAAVFRKTAQLSGAPTNSINSSYV